MATLPAANYLTDSARTEGEFKAGLEAMLASAKQIPGAGVAELVVTIAGGSITPAGSGGVLVVDTESLASLDELTNIVQTNYPDSSMVMLRNNHAARFVVCKHGATGSGQLLLSRNADYVLDDTKKFLLLQRRGTDWYEIYRAPARLEIPVVTKSATFTLGKEHHGCLLRCTGAGMVVNVPAAATLGNGFTVVIRNDNALDNEISIDLNGLETLDLSQIVNLSMNQGVTIVCDGSKFYSLGSAFKRRILSVSYGTTIFITPSAASYFDVGALTGNVTTMSIGNTELGERIRIRFVQDATGGRTVAVPSGAKIAGSLATAANQASFLDMMFSGGRWEGSWTQIPL